VYACTPFPVNVNDTDHLHKQQNNYNAVVKCFVPVIHQERQNILYKLYRITVSTSLYRVTVIVFPCVGCYYCIIMQYSLWSAPGSYRYLYAFPSKYNVIRYYHTQTTRDYVHMGTYYVTLRFNVFYGYM
jgi:hypothetical protein